MAENHLYIFKAESIHWNLSPSPFPPRLAPSIEVRGYYRRWCDDDPSLQCASLPPTVRLPDAARNASRRDLRHPFLKGRAGEDVELDDARVQRSSPCKGGRQLAKGRALGALEADDRGGRREEVPIIIRIPSNPLPLPKTRGKRHQSAAAPTKDHQSRGFRAPDPETGANHLLKWGGLRPSK